jgi:hypothetical protein
VDEALHSLCRAAAHVGFPVVVQHGLFALLLMLLCPPPCTTHATPPRHPQAKAAAEKAAVEAKLKEMGADAVNAIKAANKAARAAKKDKKAGGGGASAGTAPSASTAGGAASKKRGRVRGCLAIAGAGDAMWANNHLQSSADPPQPGSPAHGLFCLQPNVFANQLQFHAAGFLRQDRRL